MNPFDSLPNFMILGAAKAGTTTLFDVLKQHPDVYLPFDKEPMFFSYDKFFARGLGWYARTYFRRAAGFAKRGEATPHYLHWSQKTAPRIRQVYGENPLKFIVIFRDPVARAYSWYWNMVREGREKLSFEQAVEQEPRRLVENEAMLQQSGSMTYGYAHGSRYATLLQPFLEAFDRQDFLFLLQQDLNRDFTGTIRGLFEFLSLDTGFLPQPVASNQATQPRNRPVQAFLLRRSGFRERLKAIIPIRLRYAVKSKLLRLNTRPQSYPRLDPAVEEELRRRFAPEVRRLEKMIDRDLSEWLPR